MRILLAIIMMTIVVSSCKTKKEIPVVEEEKEVVPFVTNRDIPVAELGKMPRDERFRGPKIDPDEVSAQLGLTELQEQKFLAFWDKNRAEMERVKNGAGDDHDAIKQQLRQVRERANKELASFLSDDQIKKYRKILAKDRMRQRRGRKGKS